MYYGEALRKVIFFILKSLWWWCWAVGIGLLRVGMGWYGLSRVSRVGMDWYGLVWVGDPIQYDPIYFFSNLKSLRWWWAVGIIILECSGQPFHFLSAYLELAW